MTDLPASFVSSTGEGNLLTGNTTHEPGVPSNSDINADDNGTQMGNMIMSDLATLQLYREPVGDGDNDRTSNLTIDFGLFRGQNIKIYNPCTCLNNESSPGAGDGQFEERIVILSNQSGQIWAVMDAPGALNTGGTPVAIGSVAQELGTEDGLYRYIFDVRHVDGQGYTIKFTNGTDILTASNQCDYENSCHFVAPPTTLSLIHISEPTRPY